MDITNGRQARGTEGWGECVQRQGGIRGAVVAEMLREGPELRGRETEMRLRGCCGGPNEPLASDGRYGRNTN